MSILPTNAVIRLPAYTNTYTKITFNDTTAFCNKLPIGDIKNENLPTDLKSVFPTFIINNTPLCLQVQNNHVNLHEIICVNFISKIVILHQQHKKYVSHHEYEKCMRTVEYTTKPRVVCDVGYNDIIEKCLITYLWSTGENVSPRQTFKYHWIMSPEIQKYLDICGISLNQKHLFEQKITRDGNGVYDIIRVFSPGVIVLSKEFYTVKPTAVDSWKYSMKIPKMFEQNPDGFIDFVRHGVGSIDNDNIESLVQKIKSLLASEDKNREIYTREARGQIILMQYLATHDTDPIMSADVIRTTYNIMEKIHKNLALLIQSTDLYNSDMVGLLNEQHNLFRTISNIMKEQ